METGADHWHRAEKWIADSRERKEVTRINTDKLLDRILSRDNLNQAYKQVKRNQGVAGVNGMTVHEMSSYMTGKKDAIISRIRQRKYQPDLYAGSKYRNRTAECVS